MMPGPLGSSSTRPSVKITARSYSLRMLIHLKINTSTKNASRMMTDGKLRGHRLPPTLPARGLRPPPAPLPAACPSTLTTRTCAPAGIGGASVRVPVLAVHEHLAAGPSATTTSPTSPTRPSAPVSGGLRWLRSTRVSRKITTNATASAVGSTTARPTRSAGNGERTSISEPKMKLTSPATVSSP